MASAAMFVSGGLLAARLSEDPNVSVCLIEAGPADKSVLIHCPAGLALLAKNRAADRKQWLTEEGDKAEILE